ncbi:histidine phosphatase family protein [Angustibacter aerolatus]
MSARRQVLLLRHGQTAWNAAGRFQGQEDIGLDETGRAQAARAAKRLVKLHPHAVVASDLCRAWDTAAALGARTGLPVTKDERLRETYAGSWQGMTMQEIDGRYGAERAAWRSGHDVRPGGDGELRHEVGARVAEAVDEHARALPEGALLVVVSHGGAITSGLQTLLGVPREHWPVLTGLGNCHWSIVQEYRDRWTLEEHNAGTLPGDVIGDES